MNVSWTAPDGGDVLTGYKVYRRTVGTGNEIILATLGTGQTSHTDTTVAAETIYFYWVRACNDTGDSPESRRETITTQVQTSGVPNAPGRPSLSEATPGEVVARWKAPVGGADPAQYKLYRQKLGQSDNDVIATVDGTVLTHTDDTAEEKTWYYYQLRATNDSGESTAGRYRLIKTTVQTPRLPNAPRRVGASEDTPGEVVLTWNAPTGGEALTGYNVYRKPLIGTYEVIGTTGADITTYTDDTVLPETWYDYTVRATNAAGNSAEGGMETIKTKVQTEQAPPAPEDTEADQ